MTKFLSVLSFLLLSLGIFNISYAACGTINLTCAQDLELTWTSTGQDPASCDVGASSGWPGSSQCNSGGWIRIPASEVPAGQSTYTFQGQPIVQPPASMSDTCTVVKPTNCNPVGTYTISASPNPVQVCTPQTQGPTTISWTAPVGQAVDIYVNGSPTLPGNTSGSGSGSVTWIQPGQSYVFSLRKASTPTVDEATVTVTGTTAGCSSGGTGYCGDATQQTPNASGINEQCDDGNTTNGDGCSSSCQTETPPATSCGDAIIQSPNSNGQFEQCDNGASNGTFGNSCSLTCQTVSGATSCGDAIIQSPNSNGQFEQCDNGASNGTAGNSCSSTCQAVSGATFCGDSVVQSPNSNNVFEQCDLGAQNGQSGSTCSSTCVSQVPGTPMVDIGWNSSYVKTKTIALSSGQTTLNDTIYVTSINFAPNPNCNLEKENGSGGWPTVNSATSNTTTTLAVTGLTQGEHQFRYKCQNVISPIATITVTAATVTPINIGWTASPVFDPQDKTVTIASGQTTTSQTLYVTTGGRTDCALTGSWTHGGGPVRIEPVQYSSYAVNVGAGNFIYTLACQDSTKGATLIVNPPAALCGNSIIQSPETCDDGNTLSGDGCSSTCQTEPPLTLSSSCNSIVIPNRILTNQPILVTPTFGNTGTMPWTTAFSSISSGWWGVMARYPSQTINQFGTFSPSYNLTAPGTAGFYSLRFRMRNASNVEFGDYCGAAGNWVEVVNPQCSDAVDNDGDGINNFPADPGCTSGSDDDETDPAGTAILNISANPQLVRQGGSSVIAYEVDNCTSDTGGKGDFGDGTWQLIRDGVLVASGVTNTGGKASYPVLNITNKTTFTLSCLGTSRSATISVIKISEF
ncbi:MAG: DUF4215 domain-containing protein [Minisyncoccia bacterium]